jgi:hypothetical protein
MLALFLPIIFGQSSSSWYTSNQSITHLYSMNQPVSTTGNCGILDAYPAWMTTGGSRVYAPNSALPSYFNTPADPWQILASGWSAGNPSSAGTSGCFVCVHIYAGAGDYANYPHHVFPQPFVRGYVHDSESPGVIAVDDPNWYSDITDATWQGVDCPVGCNNIYYQSGDSQAAGFTKILVLGATILIKAVSFSTDGVNWLAAAQNTGDGYWISTKIRWPGTGPFPVTVYIQMTSLKGQVANDTFHWTGAAGSYVDTFCRLLTYARR